MMVNMKELKYVVGDLLRNNNLDVIAQQCNCQNTFGSGIARSIREMYPEAWLADVRAKTCDENYLGNFSYDRVAPETSRKHGTKIKFIFNLYGQNLYGKGMRQTNYEAIYTALERMADALMTTDAFSLDRSLTVGFPYKMSSDRAGADWRIIERMIEVAFGEYLGDVKIYKLDSPVP
jgi:O-acetyl-ADP-ribose deacetylase (regulator of RNase III)